MTSGLSPRTRFAKSGGVNIGFQTVGEGEAESGHLAAMLSELRGENRLVSLSYRLDDGTMIHLEERIRRIREERQQQPGSAERD